VKPGLTPNKGGPTFTQSGEGEPFRKKEKKTLWAVEKGPGGEGFQRGERVGG